MLFIIPPKKKKKESCAYFLIISNLDKFSHLVYNYCMHNLYAVFAKFLPFRTSFHYLNDIKVKWEPNFLFLSRTEEE